MACRISELVIDARDPGRLVVLRRDVLGFVELERVGGSIEIGPPGPGFGGPQPTIVFVPSPEPKAAQLRLHMDVSPTDRDQDAELTRLLAAGAAGRTSASAATRDGTCYPTPKATSSASCAPVSILFPDPRIWIKDA